MSKVHQTHPLAVVAALLAVLPQAASAQVGHAPGHSPYHDIYSRTGMVFTATYIAGSGGSLNVGPKDGWLYGARFETKLAGPTDGFLEVAYGTLTRTVIDPELSVATRTTTGVAQKAFLVDAGISVVLTGDKTWHGFAPYVGGAMGIAIGQTVPSDTSGYRFHAPFTTGPHAGMRWYLGKRLSLRAEGRLLFWRINYPATYFLPPRLAPNDPAVLASGAKTSQWTAHPSVVFSAAYHFRF